MSTILPENHLHADFCTGCKQPVYGSRLSPDGLLAEAGGRYLYDLKTHECRGRTVASLQPEEKTLEQRAVEALTEPEVGYGGRVDPWHDHPWRVARAIVNEVLFEHGQKPLSKHRLGRNPSLIHPPQHPLGGHPLDEVTKEEVASYVDDALGDGPIQGAVLPTPEQEAVANRQVAAKQSGKW